MDVKTEINPNIVGQALHLLDKMNVAYRFIPESELWEFVYDGLYMLLVNDCKDNEFGLYAPVLITDTDDEEIQKMVYDCSVPSIEQELSANCDFGYNGNGLCHVSKWWAIQGNNPGLTKKIFMEKLKEMQEYQIKMYFILHCTYEGMFNPPPEVLREIFKDLKFDKNDGE